MVNFKLQLENASFSLIQTKTSHFEELYSVAINPVIWEQHPDYDKWKRGVFIIFALIIVLVMSVVPSLKDVPIVTKKEVEVSLTKVLLT